MSWRIAVGLYIVIWWTILFAVLPFGVKTQADAGEVVPGTEPGAPLRPMLLKKMLWTTLIAAVVLAVTVAVITYAFPQQVL